MAGVFSQKRSLNFFLMFPQTLSFSKEEETKNSSQVVSRSETYHLKNLCPSWEHDARIIRFDDQRKTSLFSRRQSLINKWHLYHLLKSKKQIFTRKNTKKKAFVFWFFLLAKENCFSRLDVTSRWRVNGIEGKIILTFVCL